MSQDETFDMDAGGDHRVSRRGLLGGAAAGTLGLAALLQARGRDASAQTAPQPTGPLVFGLEVEGQAVGLFRECSGLGAEVSVVDHGSGVQDPQARPAPGTFKPTPVVLRRGVTSALELSAWQKQVEDGGAKWKDARKNGSIVLYSQTHEEVARWELLAAWPSRLTVGVGQLLTGEIVVLEEVTLMSERITRVR